MIRLSLIISLILLATSTYAQSSPPLEATTTAGRIVILKSDGTWEFKKITPQPSPIPATNLVKQDIVANSLPSDFAGHDQKKLFIQLLDLRKRLVKSEFETTAEYEKRAAAERQKPILGSLTIKDTFSLVISSVEAEYDADLQKMKFSLPVWKSEQAELRRSIRMTEDKKTAPELSYVNLYSIKLDSSKEGEGIFFDETNGLQLSRRSFSPYYLFSAEVNLNVEEAKRLKTTTKAVVLVQFEEPYASEWIGRQQFQVRLIDVYFFDPQTGKILAKMSQVGK